VFRLRLRQVIALLALLSQVVTTAFAHMPLEMTTSSAPAIAQAMSGDAAAIPAPHCHGDDSGPATQAFPQTSAQRAQAFPPAFKETAPEAGALAQPEPQSSVRRTHVAEGTAASALHAMAAHSPSSQPAHSQHDPNAPCKHGTACKCPCAHFPALAVSLTLAPRVPHSPIAITDYEQAPTARPTPLFRPPI